MFPEESSRLARALWIEIKCPLDEDGIYKSRLARALWIEIRVALIMSFDSLTSRLARALWIEI